MQSEEMLSKQNSLTNVQKNQVQFIHHVQLDADRPISYYSFFLVEILFEIPGLAHKLLPLALF